MRLLNNALAPQRQLLHLNFLTTIIQPLAVVVIIALLIIPCIEGQAQDCLHDTIPPEIICKQDYIYRYGWCGNEEIYASDFVISATDNCSKVKITFDREGKNQWDDSFILWMDPSWPNGQIKIYARDTSGNISECIATYKAVPGYSIRKTISCKLITQFREENDKIELNIRTNDNAIHKATLINDSGNSLNFQVSINGDQTIKSLILEALDKPFNHYYISTADAIETIYEILDLGRYSSPVNLKSEDTDCNGELNFIDIYQIKNYLYGINLTDSCIGRPILYFIDSIGTILGKEIPFQENQNTVPIIAFNQIGDVNKYLPVSKTVLPNPITRFGGEPLIWQASDISCKQGNQYLVGFTLNDSISLFGFQYNFTFDDKLIRLDTFYSNYTSYPYKHIYQNDIKTAWMNISNPKFENDYPKITILFTAKSDFSLSDAFKPKIQSISNFAITSDGTIRPIVTEFSIVNATANEDKDRPWFKISNAFASQNIRIHGTLTPSRDAELVIYTIYGQPIYSQQVHAIDGIFNESFRCSNSGIYYAVLKLYGKKQLVQSFVVIK